MLDDKDRIFKNLYGLHDWGLQGARRRANAAMVDHGHQGLQVVQLHRRLGRGPGFS